MNQIFFRSENIPLPSWKKSAEVFIKKVLKALHIKNWELSVLFCDNAYIKTLNANFRNKGEATDVLAFPLGEMSPAGNWLAGDIVISLETLEENSRLFKVSKSEELCRLLVHAILHLNGEDHKSNNSDEPMLRHQEQILAGITVPETLEKDL